MAKWGVEYSWLGEVTDTNRLVITWNGEVIVDVDPKTVAHDGPVYDRPYARPDWQDALQADTFRSSAAGRDLPGTGEQLKAAVLELIASRTCATSPGSPASTTATWVATPRWPPRMMPAWCAWTKRAGWGWRSPPTPMAATPTWILTQELNWRWPSLPQRGHLRGHPGGGLRLPELRFPRGPGRNVAAGRGIRGLSDACMELGVPVTGGNVSLYNQTGEKAIHPTPVVATLGKLDDVARRTPSGWRAEADGQAIYLIGKTLDELDGSEYANLRGHLGGLPPKVDLAAEKALGQVLINASRDGMIDAAHDLSEGGLAAALSEMVLRYGVGARVALDEIMARDGIDAFTALFSETQARALVAVPRSEEVRFNDMTSARGITVARIGVVDAESNALEVQGHFTASVEELREVHEGTMEKYFG